MRQTGMRTAWENREIAGDPRLYANDGRTKPERAKKNRPRRGGKLKIFSVFDGESYFFHWLNQWFKIFRGLIVNKESKMIC